MPYTPYTPYPVERFAGLNVLDDPQEVGAQGATDLLNVDLDRRGRLHTRAGVTKVDASGGTTAYHALYPAAFAPQVMLLFRTSGDNLLVDKSSLAGTISAVGTVGSLAGANPRLGSVATLGTTSSTLVFMATIPGPGVTGGTTLRKYDGTTLANSVGSPGFVAVTPWGNRLAQARYNSAADTPSGANGSPSTVFFSDSGAPETYTSTSWATLTPGDGESIGAMVAWRELLFVFKSSRMFVFPQPTVNTSGAAAFDNYRTVALGARAFGGDYVNGLGKGTAVAATDAVYFLAADGLYRTTGGPPERVSDLITPIFDGSASSSLAVDGTEMSLQYADQRLFLSYTNASAAKRTLVYDPRTGQWVLWSFATAAGGFVEWNTSSTKEQRDVFMVMNDSHFYKFSDSATDDNGTAIASSYQAGFYEMGPAGVDVFTRWSRLWGYGAPTFSLFTDMGTTDANAGTVTLGTSPAVAEGYHLKSYKGKLFSHKISASSGAWSVSRLQHDAAWVRS